MEFYAKRDAEMGAWLLYENIPRKSVLTKIGGMPRYALTFFHSYQILFILSLDHPAPVHQAAELFDLHHHLIPIPGTGRERQIPVDAGDVLQLCQELDLDLVLSGHRHVPWVWKLEDTHFVTAGTTTSRRLKGRSHPSLNLFVLEDGKLELHEMDVSRGEYHRVQEC